MIQFIWANHNLQTSVLGTLNLSEKQKVIPWSISQVLVL